MINTMLGLIAFLGGWIMKKLDKIQENIQSCMLHKRRKDDSCAP